MDAYQIDIAMVAALLSGLGLVVIWLFTGDSSSSSIDVKSIMFTIALMVVMLITALASPPSQTIAPPRATQLAAVSDDGSTIFFLEQDGRPVGAPGHVSADAAT